MNPLYERGSRGRIRPARAEDAEGVRAIRNRAITHTTALWTETPQSTAAARAWLAVHRERGSAFVAEVDGEVAGFAAYGPWRGLDGFRATVDDSVYVREDMHGLGLGSALLAALLDGARAAGHHVVVADIEAQNASSIRLHERFGFRVVGTMPEVGRKFGRWFDLTIMQLELDRTPAAA